MSQQRTSILPQQSRYRKQGCQWQSRHRQSRANWFNHTHRNPSNSLVLWGALPGALPGAFPGSYHRGYCGGAALKTSRSISKAQFQGALPKIISFCVQNHIPRIFLWAFPPGLSGASSETILGLNFSGSFARSINRSISRNISKEILWSLCFLLRKGNPSCLSLRTPRITSGALSGNLRNPYGFCNLGIFFLDVCVERTRACRKWLATQESNCGRPIRVCKQIRKNHG